MPTNGGGKSETGEGARGSGRGGAASRTGSEGHGRGRRTERGHPRDDARLDLLTAALIGVAVGASATLLLRRGPRGHRPIGPAVRAAARAGRRGARWVRERGEDAWEQFPHEEVADQVRDYARSAREAIDRAVRSEMRTLRRSLRAQVRKVTR